MSGDNEGRVKRRTGHGHTLVDDTHTIQPLGARCETVAADPHDKGTCTANGLLAHQIRVTHNEVKGEMGFERDVRSPIDSDDKRSGLRTPPGERATIARRFARGAHQQNRTLAEGINRRHALTTQNGRTILGQVVFDRTFKPGE